MGSNSRSLPEQAVLSSPRLLFCIRDNVQWDARGSTEPMEVRGKIRQGGIGILRINTNKLAIFLLTLRVL